MPPSTPHDATAGSTAACHAAPKAPCRPLAALLAVLVLAVCAGESPAANGTSVERPRPLSPAERAAVDLALEYLADGAEAWLPHLDPQGPLGALEPAAALAEIGARAGPPERAAWQLQTPGPGQPAGRTIFSIEFPSGVGETLVIDLVRAGPGRTDAPRNGWRIHELRGLVDPWDTSPAARAAAPGEEAGSHTASGGPPRISHSPRPGRPASPASSPATAPLATMLFATLLPVLLFLRSRFPPEPGAVAAAGSWSLAACRPAVRQNGLGLAGVAVAAALALLLACGGDENPAGEGATAPAASASPSLTRLGDLVPLRRAVALGGDREHIDELAFRLPSGGPLGTAADLWTAELALGQTDLSEAEAILDRLPADSPVPLGELLRARLAFARGDAGAVAQSYDRLLSRGPDHDGLRLEAADALGTLGRSIDAEVAYDLLTEMGSRLADVHYGKAQFAALHGNDEEGEAHLRQAWELQPAERSVLLSSPLLARLLARTSVFPLFELSSPGEPRPALPPAAERLPLALPPGAAARLSGSLLRVELGGRSGERAGGGILTVPGGRVLAPDSTVLLAADELRRRREAAVLDRLPELHAAAGELSALAQPRRRTEVLQAGRALARRNRWRELEALTAGLHGSDLGPVPGDLVQLRAAALTHLQRNDEARALLIRLAHSDLANQRRDPGSLYQLAELVASEGEYDLALRLLRKAAVLSPLQGNPLRTRQLAMQKRLAAAHSVWETDHFRVVYPRRTGERYARLLGTVLEEELARIERWIPYPRGGEAIEVQLYPLDEFLRAYSGGALVLGLYDGVVRVPFAELRSLHPEIVSILSHELAHAMIGRATAEQAPKWFHEGMAEHVQMTQDWINPIPDLHAASRVIAFPVIEPILRGFAEPQLLELAYGEAAWTVHYIEARHGVGALHRLLAAFRDGSTTPEALERVLGVTEAEFDAAVRRWCLESAPATWPTRVRRYDHELDLPFERSRERRRREGESSAPLAAPGESHRGAMERWHRRYAQRIAPFKRRLATVMEDLGKGRVDRHGPTCQALRDDLDALLAEPALLGAPAPDVGRHLHDALDRFRSMARACAAGNGERARAYYREAERALARAAQELGAYGLRP